MRQILTIIIITLIAFSNYGSQKSYQEVEADTLMSIRYRQGLASTRAGLYNDALRYWLEYLEMAENREGKVKGRELYTAYLAVGSIHFAFEDYESALSFFKKGEALSKTKGDSETQTRFLNNLVGSYAELGEIEKSTASNEEMNRMAKELGLKEFEHRYYFNKGYIARKKGDTARALKYMRRSLRELEEDKTGESPVYAYSELYTIYESRGELDSALYYLHKFEGLADKPFLQLDCYKGLMRLYTKRGDNGKSLEYQNLYFHVADSVLNSRDFLQARNSWLFNEQSRTQRHIAGLEENILRWRTGIILISTVLILIVVIAVILYRQKSRLNAMNADLFEKNRELIELHDRIAEEWRSEKNRLPEATTTPETEEGEATEEAEDSDSKRRQDDLLARIIDFMETSEKFLESEFSMAQLAKEVGSNTKYVSQVINEKTGKPFRSFINDYRIKVAQERMLNYAEWGNMTIKSIGESVGFKSPANFIAAFKKGTGMTPSVYLSISKSKKG